MPETLNLHLSAGGLSASLAEAGAEISRLAREEIAPAAALIEEAFSSAARAIENDLARAARTGELSLKGLARALVQDLKRAAVETLVRKPVESVLASALAGAFAGARAFGGPVAAGGAYLVGERGPELFAPPRAGRIATLAASPVNVSIVVPGVANPDSFRASETQIAAALARVLAKAARNQ
jgi:phage-related minor tail protein